MRRSLLSNQDWDFIHTWQLAAPNRTVLTPDNADYPPLLKEMAEKPAYLFVEGQLSLLKAPSIALVGSRHPTHAGLNNAQQFAFELAQAGFVITSGMALGIDTASHQGALQHNGATIAVQGTGLDVIYPKQNEKLRQHILEQGGALLSEYPLKTPPLAHHFPRRNRIIAGLSVGVLVVEAALKSGSLITARLALEANRELFAIPGSIHSPLSKGCHQLIQNGAKLVESAADIYEELGQFSSLAVHPPSALKIATPIEKLAKGCELLVKCVDYAPTPLDMIVMRSGLDAATVSVKLLELELIGVIERHPSGYMRNI